MGLMGGISLVIVNDFRCIEEICLFYEGKDTDPLPKSKSLNESFCEGGL